MPIEFAPPSPNLQGFQVPGPAYEDPLATLAKLGQVRTQNLQRQQQQMELDSMRGALRAYAESGGDPDKFEALAPKYGVAPGVVVDFKTKIADLAAKRAATQLSQTQNEKAAAEARDTEHDQLYQAYQPVWDAKPEEQEGLINSINAGLQSQGWDPNKLMQYTSPQDVQLHKDIYTTHKQIQLAADQQLKRAQQAKEEAETAKAQTETQGAQTAQMINDIRRAEQDPKQNVPTPAAWSAILQKYPKAGLPQQPTPDYISRLVESTIPQKDVPEYNINQMKARLGLLGNDKFDQYQLRYAQSIGKRPADLNFNEFQAMTQQYAKDTQNPEMLATMLALRASQGAMAAQQVSNMPSEDELQSLARDYRNMDMSPKQIQAYREGRVQYFPAIVQRARAQAEAEGKPFSPAQLDVMYDTWDATEKAFAHGGQEAGMVRSFGNLIKHASMAVDASKALSHHDLPLLQRLAGGIGVATGGSAETVYDTIADFVADEASKAFLPGGGGQAEREGKKFHFDRSLGDKQREDNLKATLALADSQREELEKQYKEGTFGKGPRIGKLFDKDILDARDRVLGKTQQPTLQLKSGRTAYFQSQQEADRFKRDHPELVK